MNDERRSRRWLLSGLIAGVVSFLARPLEAKKKPKKHTIRFNRAEAATIPWEKWEQPNDEWPVPHVAWMHTCCDCKLTHAVFFAMLPEGLFMAWDVDEKETRMRRLGSGLTPPGIAEAPAPQTWGPRAP